MEQRVALFGNSHASRRAFPDGREPELERRFGRHVVAMKWVRPNGGVLGGLGGSSNDDWLRLERAAAELRTDRDGPSHAVISMGGPALVPKLGDMLQPAPVQPYVTAPQAAERVVRGMTHFVQTLTLTITGIVPVIESVIPGQDLSEAALALFRDLSESLRQVAKQNECRFLDVEEVVRRHLAGADAGPSLGPAPGTASRSGLGEDPAVEAMARLTLEATGAAGVPWECGWVAGCPPCVRRDAPRLPAAAYSTDRAHLSAAGYRAVRRELFRIIYA